MMSDSTKVQHVPWKTLKEFAMKEDFETAGWFKDLDSEDQETVIRLRNAQLEQNQKQGDLESMPLVKLDVTSDLLQELKERVVARPDHYNGLYFTEQGEVFVIGVIDCLTNFDTRKKCEHALKKIRFVNDQTDEGYSTISCIPPADYAERFKNFVSDKFKISNKIPTARNSPTGLRNKKSTGLMNEIEMEFETVERGDPEVGISHTKEEETKKGLKD